MLRIRLLSLRACLILLTLAAARFAATQPAPRIEYPQKRLIDITGYLKSAHDLSGDSITDFFFMVGNPWLW